MKAILLIPALLLCSCAGVPIVGSIESPYGSASYSSKGGVEVSADAGAIAQRLLSDG